MIRAFWDTSALVPLCVEQQPTAATRRLLARHAIAVWWATPVEMRSAFARLLQTGLLTPEGYTAAGTRLESLRRGWRELQPTEALRSQAEVFVTSYPLKAADAFQLAAAWTWCSGDAGRGVFISGDAQLLDAARHIGFEVTAV